MSFKKGTEAFIGHQIQSFLAKANKGLESVKREIKRSERVPFQMERRGDKWRQQEQFFFLQKVQKVDRKNVKNIHNLHKQRREKVTSSRLKINLSQQHTTTTTSQSATQAGSVKRKGQKYNWGRRTKYQKGVAKFKKYYLR
uniref:Uncharacterized protein n=1 Tax=Cacopsylla melanoneura TaxID=428564 RepID=A0A8D8RBJ0_9HEMI